MGFPQMRARKMLLLIAHTHTRRAESALAESEERALLFDATLSINLLKFERPCVNFDHIEFPSTWIDIRGIHTCNQLGFQLVASY
jgi:hypothetical protein